MGTNLSPPPPIPVQNIPELLQRHGGRSSSAMSAPDITLNPLSANG